jgi:hypothetical protein
MVSAHRGMNESICAVSNSHTSGFLPLRAHILMESPFFGTVFGNPQSADKILWKKRLSIASSRGFLLKVNTKQK